MSSLENLALVKLSKLMALHRELEVVANNIANINTAGYKADGSVFQEFLMPLARDGSFQGNDQRLSYVHDRATWHNFAKGPILQTGNPLDVSIDGDAFLVVQTARGERYTRNGSLQINATGQLVTQSGDLVLGEGGPIQFQSTDSAVSINPDGTITVREAGNSTSDSARGKIRLVRFESAATLLKDGASMFRAPDGTAPQPADANARVFQGTIEQSNVSAVSEMARMVELTRTYSQISSMILQMAEHRRSAIEKLADVPA
jgi:flagellar basal-body rod protein FlgF/flagellar basal-body rod protein FlgG